MTDGGVWRPPDPGTGTTEIPVTAVDLEPRAPAPRKRSSGVVIAAGVGAAVIVGAAVFGVTRLADDDAGGAASPEEAGLAFLTAFENEDVLGMVDILLPGERETLGEPVTTLTDELSRLEVLSEEADLSNVAGVDIVLEDESVRAESTNVDEIVNLDISATGTGTVDGEQLPIGDLILDNTDVDLSELDTDEPAEAPEDLTLRVTAVEEDGRWYLSLFHTVAETIRGEQEEPVDIPAEGVAPTGGDSPEDAFDAFLAAIEQLDLEALVATLNPDEFQALQRYAPAFLEDAQASLDENLAAEDVTVTIADPEYTVSGSGDTRSLTIDYFRVDLTSGGETVSGEFEDGCWNVTGNGEAINSCELDPEETPALEERFGDPELVREVLATLEETFADYENPGFIVKRVDGQWYVSPFATVSEQLLAVLGALDRSEIDRLIEQGRAIAEEATDAEFFDVENLFGPDDGDFQADAESFIEDDEGNVEAQLGVGLDEATCEEPASPDAGTVFGCTAVGSDGTTYEFTVEITGENSYEVSGGTPGD